ncbi:arginase family protein [Mycetocola manganoxydans]|uniref:Arginase family protein n=1 Tax=Mycetocola manganoxydans TaxID=699879 RepID=A0A3L7A1A5_9MICO|nr:arginase family protein [Mycetocola manganoxydans]RLP73790.1 arginase family protein [Mycetocola manganoxydans]GHD43053.1 arginase [Mycetocola manganoxydans]
MATFVVVPAWQGSGSSRAMRLIDGAEAIRGDLPSTATTVVDVPPEAGDSLDSGVNRLSSLRIIRERQDAVLRAATGPVITVGGGCSVELAAINAVLSANDDTCVLWFDAHPDLNTPESSPSGSFDGMVLRALLGGVQELAPKTPLSPERVIMIGARDVDQGEQDCLDDTGMRMLSVEDATPDAVIEAVAASGASKVYVHVDLDVLDPADIAGTDWAEPFGLPAATLVELIGAVKGKFGFSGGGITGFAPASSAHAVDDLGTILRILGALAR